MTLARWLEGKGWSDVEAARRLSTPSCPVSREAVRLWRHRRRTPSPATAARIARITGGAVTAADMQRKE